MPEASCHFFRISSSASACLWPLSSWLVQADTSLSIHLSPPGLIQSLLIHRRSPWWSTGCGAAALCRTRWVQVPAAGPSCLDTFSDCSSVQGLPCHLVFTHATPHEGHLLFLRRLQWLTLQTQQLWRGCRFLPSFIVAFGLLHFHCHSLRAWVHQ